MPNALASPRKTQIVEGIIAANLAILSAQYDNCGEFNGRTNRSHGYIAVDTQTGAIVGINISPSNPLYPPPILSVSRPVAAGAAPNEGHVLLIRGLDHFADKAIKAIERSFQEFWKSKGYTGEIAYTTDVSHSSDIFSTETLIPHPTTLFRGG